MTRQVFDAIVVGSGIAGGWAAKELSERGLRTLVLERGPFVEDCVDFTTEGVPDCQLRFRGQGDRLRQSREQFVQCTSGSYTEATAQYYINDALNPYTHAPNRPFAWIRSHQLGGRSLIWYRQCYRLSDLDFTANLRDGIAADWPIRYRDIKPWYDYVESYIGVSGQSEGLSQLPDGPFLPPMPLNIAERVGSGPTAESQAGTSNDSEQDRDLDARAQRPIGVRILWSVRSRLFIGCTFYKLTRYSPGSPCYWQSRHIDRHNRRIANF